LEGIPFSVTEGREAFGRGEWCGVVLYEPPSWRERGSSKQRGRMIMVPRPSGEKPLEKGEKKRSMLRSFSGKKLFRKETFP